RKSLQDAEASRSKLRQVEESRAHAGTSTRDEAPDRQTHTATADADIVADPSTKETRGQTSASAVPVREEPLQDADSKTSLTSATVWIDPKPLTAGSGAMHAESLSVPQPPAWPWRLLRAAALGLGGLTGIAAIVYLLSWHVFSQSNISSTVVAIGIG